MVGTPKAAPHVGRSLHNCTPAQADHKVTVCYIPSYQTKAKPNLSLQSCHDQA